MKLENISGMIIEHLKDKIYELELNTTNRNFSEFYQDINESKGGYKHTNEFIASLIGGRITACRLMNVIGVNDDRRSMEHSTEPLVGSPGYSEFRADIDK